MNDSKSESDRSPERRLEDRRLTCVVAEVETAENSAVALIRNVSRGGALLAVPCDLAVDSRIEMTIHATTDPAGKKINAIGTIVRREVLDASVSDLWRFELGVRFDEQLDLDDAELAAITRQLQKK